MKTLDEIASFLGIDMEEELPDFSDPEVIRRLAEDFTAKCLSELEAGDWAEVCSRAGMREVLIL